MPPAAGQANRSRADRAGWLAGWLRAWPAKPQHDIVPHRAWECAGRWPWGPVRPAGGLFGREGCLVPGPGWRAQVAQNTSEGGAWGGLGGAGGSAGGAGARSAKSDGDQARGITRPLSVNSGNRRTQARALGTRVYVQIGGGWPSSKEPGSVMGIHSWPPFVKTTAQVKFALRSPSWTSFASVLGARALSLEWTFRVGGRGHASSVGCMFGKEVPGPPLGRMHFWFALALVPGFLWATVV